MSLFIKYFDSYLSTLSEQTVYFKGKTWKVTAIIILRLAMKFNETQFDMFREDIVNEEDPDEVVHIHQNIYDEIANLFFSDVYIIN